jgi:hypothetical protein
LMGRGAIVALAMFSAARRSSMAFDRALRFARSLVPKTAAENAFPFRSAS